MPFRSLDLGLLGDFAREGYDVELFHLQPRHIAFQLGDGIQVIDDIDEPVDAFLRAFEVLAVNQVVLQAAVEQRRDIPLHVENRGFELMGHVAQVLLAELFGLLQAGDLLVVGVGPRGELLGDVLHMLVLELGENFARMHVAREDDRIDRLELVSHVFADDKQREQRHRHESRPGDTEHQPPHGAQQRHHQRDDGCGAGRDEQGRPLLGFDRNHLR